MKKYLFTALFAVILSFVMAPDSDAQILPDDIIVNTDPDFGGGPRRSEQVTYIVAYDENDVLVDYCEECVENALYIEMLVDDPTLYIEEVVVDETTE